MISPVPCDEEVSGTTGDITTSDAGAFGAIDFGEPDAPCAFSVYGAPAGGGLAVVVRYGSFVLFELAESLAAMGAVIGVAEAADWASDLARYGS